MNYDKPVRSTANPSPLRRAGSIRRTSSLDVTWPSGGVELRRFEGRSRDVIKGADGADQVRAEARLTADLDFDRKIIAISADPAPAQ